MWVAPQRPVLFHQTFNIMFQFKILFTWLLLFFSFDSLGQYVVSGIVRDEAGQPLPGANVVLAPSESATAADAEGKFRISNIGEGSYEMRVSFVGYTTQVRSLTVTRNTNLVVVMKESSLLKDEVIVYATRANELTPTTYTNFSQKEIENRNLGQDMPILLNFTPSAVTNSDAGGGIGYTDIRIRGSDGTRINVTINGVPVNDSESHGVFWVNMPDHA